MVIDPMPGDPDQTTEGISVELVPDGLWVQRGSSPDEWNCVFVSARELNLILNREIAGMQ